MSLEARYQLPYHVFPVSLLRGDVARTFFLLHKHVSLLPQFPDPTAHSSLADLQTPEPLLCREASKAVCSLGNGTRPLPRRTAALPAGPPTPARVLAHLLPALDHAVPTTGVSLLFSPSKLCCPGKGLSSVTVPTKVAYHGLPQVRVGHSLVLLIIFSCICISSPSKLLFPS